MADSNPAALIRRAKRQIPTTDKWRDSAEKVLYWASCSLKDPGANEFNDRAYSLVDRCFMISEHGADQHSKIAKDLAKIKTCFRRLAKFYAAVKAHGGFLRVGPSRSPGERAYAQIGGYQRADPNGITFVFAACKTLNDESMKSLITHESVHFAGNIGHAHIGGKVAYGKDALRLRNSEALKNASNYTWLAYLARMPHTRWLTAT